jgi:ATP-dependent Zn protease
MDNNHVCFSFFSYFLMVLFFFMLGILFMNSLQKHAKNTSISPSNTLKQLALCNNFYVTTE